MDDLVTMSTTNKVNDEPILRMNFSSYKKYKPVIVEIKTMKIKITNHNLDNLDIYLKNKDMIQSTYEDAINTSQKFVIPKLKEMEQKYYPMCCENFSRLERQYKKDHKHFEYKIIQLLQSLQNYLENNIEITQRVLEIKLM